MNNPRRSKSTFLFRALALTLVLPTGLARADVWDKGGGDDDATTSNRLTHGMIQTHDLDPEPAGNPADEDWFLLGSARESSYEVRVEGWTANLGLEPVNVQRLTATSALLPMTDRSRPGALAFAWIGGREDDFLRVHTPDCGPSCANSAYTVRFYETTTSIARFNNSGSQVSVLFLQNPQAVSTPIAGTIRLWNSMGGLAASMNFSLASRQQLVLNLQGLAPATSGHITIAHNGAYGSFQGKVVQLEPVTGFSFDTAMEWIPY